MVIFIKTLRFSTLFICSLLFNKVLAQKSHYLQFGFGAGIYIVMDDAISSNKYAGNNFTFHLGYSMRDSNKICVLNLNGHYGKLKSDAGFASSTALLLGADIDYRRLYHVRNFFNEKWDWHLGGGLLTHALYRKYHEFSNNAWQYDYVNSLSLESNIEKKTSFRERDIIFGWQLSLPVFSAFIRPSYNSSLPEGFLYYPNKPVKAALKSFDFATVNNYSRAVSGINLTYKLLNGNAFQMKYNWDFYYYEKHNPLTVATHSIQFILLFNLSEP